MSRPGPATLGTPVVVAAVENGLATAGNKYRLEDLLEAKRDALLWFALVSKNV